jgi:hypothetical protein
MHNKSFRSMFLFTCSALILITLAAAACSPVSKQSNANKNKALLPVINQGQAGETYADPFSFCTAAGTIDKPDARYTGEQVPDTIIQGYIKSAGLQNSTEPSDQFKKSTIWRCMDGSVYACNFGANLPCDSQANTDKNPTQAMADFCKENANSDFIPMAVTGHTTIYSWRCNNDKPEVDKQINHADSSGFIAEIWYKIEK